ncbi:hypothetical protein SAMN04490244_105363 [Tranquillimonas rosea]|uniref:Permease n=1 Tax=Tranquillimonas rosea TaxID=641238 RepID=A0A1H9ULN7_9RHOB|nr:AEC family transporter [Tranquillimonas rosea]SES10094.1 hypothetical protein SAMN04490244_105363 [Tranquillimonas rosea]
MLDILSITFPIFATIGIGYGAVAIGLFTAADLRVLGRYVVNIALPALLFSAVATRDLGEVLHPTYLAVYALGSLVTIVIGYGALRATGTGPARRAVGVMGMSCPNSGYVGYPILLLAMPDIAATVLAQNVIIENFLCVPLSLALLDMSRPQEGRGPLAVLGSVAWSVVTRPFVIGLLLGLAVSVSGLPLPTGLTRLADILAASASALALVVVGGTLYGLPMRGERALAGLIAGGKLLLHPAMIALMLLVLPALGLPALDAELKAAVVLSAAMPMLGIYAILAQPYGHDGVASIALLTATAGAFLTVNALLVLLT